MAQVDPRQVKDEAPQAAGRPWPLVSGSAASGAMKLKKV
jgi:hypothetical protein